ncbi:MAG: hypothetical protein K2J82_04755 [Muribaculaceae bacterium]|nr:hypothetical protein [Muribaculaceae bacterium]MDE6753908.1 hypothetical protein [Muribaculaceae bacterium]
MVYKFKLVSDEVSNFSREIEIDSTSTFLQLRNAVLESVGYAKDDMSSFFLCDDQWQREEEITFTDMGSSSDQDVWLMEDTPLNEFIEEEGQKLTFVFDYLTERSFFMEMKEEIPGRNLSEPICTVKRGTPPPQYTDLEEFEKQLDIAAKKQVEDLDLDMDDIYGDTGYNEDELGSGFDELSDFNE